MSTRLGGGYISMHLLLRLRSVDLHILAFSIDIHKRCHEGIMNGSIDCSLWECPSVWIRPHQIIFSFWSTARMPFWKIEFIRTIVLLYAACCITIFMEVMT